MYNQDVFMHNENVYMNVSNTIVMHKPWVRYAITKKLGVIIA